MGLCCASVGLNNKLVILRKDTERVYGVVGTALSIQLSYMSDVNGRATVQTVSRLPRTTQARVRSQVSAREICGEA